MHDVVQAPPRVRISEDQLTKALAVDPAVFHVALAELPNDRIESRRTGLVDGVRGFVRVDDDRPLLPKHLSHRRLPRACSTRETDQLHGTGAREWCSGIGGRSQGADKHRKERTAWIRA